MNHPPPLEWIYVSGKEIWIWPLGKQNTELIEAGEEAKKMQGMHFTFQREPGICSTSSSCQLQNSSDLAEAPWPDVTLIWFSWLRLLLWNEQQSRARMALPGAPCTRNRRRKSSPAPPNLAVLLTILTNSQPSAGRIWEVEGESRTKGICLTAASLWVMGTAQILSGCFPCRFKHFSTQSLLHLPGQNPALGFLCLKALLCLCSTAPF